MDDLNTYSNYDFRSGFIKRTEETPTERRLIGELDGGLKERDGEPVHKHRHSEAVTICTHSSFNPSQI